MTVSSETARWDYVGNGALTTYPFTAEIYVATDLKVYVANALKTLNTHYTIAAASIENPDGGNVVFTAAHIPASNEAIAIILDLPITQLVDYEEGDAFPAETHERALDRQIKIAQALDSRFRHVPKLDEDSPLDLTMPDPLSNAYLGWNAAATNLENKTDPVVVPVAGTQYEIDALITYGGGTAYTKATIDSALAGIGTSNPTVLLLRPGAWAITANADYSSYKNVTFKMPNGSYFAISSGVTLTLPSPAHIEAQFTQKVFACAGTGAAGFASGDGTISVKWFGALGDNSNDDTAEIQSAFDAATDAAVSFQAHATEYHYAVPTIYFPAGVYVVSDTILPGAVIVVTGDRSIIRGSNAAKDIIDFVYIYQAYFKSIVFMDGKSHVAFTNPNIGGQLVFDECEFCWNNTSYVLRSYATDPFTYFDIWVSLKKCRFIFNTKILSSLPANIIRFSDCYFAGGTPFAGAQIVNKGRLYFDNFDGSPSATPAIAGSRWIDNYGYLFIDNSRFGSEGGGMPIVYQYEPTVAKTYYLGGSVISIQHSALLCGATGVENTIVRLMTGIPSQLIIKNNHYIVKDTTDFIKIDGGFDIATYIAAMNALELDVIDIEGNSAYLPLENIGLPALLTDTDRSKVRVCDAFEPYIKGYTKKALFHFDGANAGTIIPDEYYSKAFSLVGNAALSTSVKRFGSASLALDGTGDYLYTPYILTLGSAFTIEFWWRTSNNTGDQEILRADNAGSYGLVLFYDTSDNSLKLYVSSNGSSWNVANATLGTANFSDDTWYKIVIEYTGAAYTVYVGTPGAIVAADIVVASANAPCAIISFKLGNGTVGYIDEFRMLIGDYRYGGLFIPESEAFKID